MEIMTTVEKIIYFRKKYKISQQDLVRDKVARSYLAMVETGSKPLGKNLLRILVENFAEIFAERGINETITEEFLLKTKEEQITEKTEEYFAKLDQIEFGTEEFEELITNIEKLFFKEHSPTNKIKLFKKLGDIYYTKTEYEKSKSFYIRILNEMYQTEDYETLGEIIISLTNISNFLNSFSEILGLEQSLKESFKFLEFDIRGKIMFNLALIHFNVGNYEQALEYFVILEKEAYNDKEFFEILNMKALCYKNLEKYDKAVSIYRGLLIRYEAPQNKILCNTNLMLIYKTLDDEKKVKYYLRKTKNLMKEIYDRNEEDHPFIIQADAVLGEIGQYLGNSRLAISSYEKALEAKDNYEGNKVEFVGSNIRGLLKLYGGRDISKVKELEDIYFETLYKNEGYTDISFNFIDYYYRNNYFTEVDRYLKKVKG